MSPQIKNKIEAKDISINNLLKGKKFTIDYFEREYLCTNTKSRVLLKESKLFTIKNY